MITAPCASTSELSFAFGLPASDSVTETEETGVHLTPLGACLLAFPPTADNDVHAAESMHMQALRCGAKDGGHCHDGHFFSVTTMKTTALG
jgi:hypothetical protein